MRLPTRWRIAPLLLVSVLFAASTATAATQVPEDDDDDDDDDYGNAVVWINDTEIDEDGGLATFTVFKYGRTQTPVTVDVFTRDGTATAGSDYVETSETITFPRRRVVSRTFTVPIVDDAVDERKETFSAVLRNPDGVSIERKVAVATIKDNDKAGVLVDEDDGLYVLEGGDPDSFEISFRSAPAAPVKVTLLTDDDQVSLSPEALSVDAGNWSDRHQIIVTAVEDGMDEDDPHAAEIAIQLESADSNYDEIGLEPVPVTIGDADALLVSIRGPNAGVPNQPVSFDAIVNAGGSGEITYDWTAYFAGNEVASGTEQTFVFTPKDPGPYVVRALVGDDQGQTPAEFVEFMVLGDIAESVFVEEIVWLANEEITRGCNPPDNDLFCPEGTVTRGQMAAFLVRFLDLTDDGGGNPFTDDDGSIFENDIAKIAAADITTGCNPEGTRYCPNDPVTRAEMAAFLVRSLELTDGGDGNPFTDDDGSIFENDIAKIAAADITTGCNPEGTQYCPNEPISRGQMAAFLYRAAELLP